jgi:cytochrome c biogenesis protein CcmG, thiol:disulfide interchange protein DsbE
MRRALYVLPMLLFLALAGYFVVALRPGYDPSLLPSALLDKPAPAFALAGLDGAPGLDRTALQGQVTLVNFFASWCAPCRIEQPLLLRLARDKSVRLYGIAYKDKPEDTEQYLKELGDPYARIGVDESGRVGINFGVYGVPETYVIDKEGRIRLRHVGPLSAEDVDRKILPLLQKLGAT